MYKTTNTEVGFRKGSLLCYLPHKLESRGYYARNGCTMLTERQLEKKEEEESMYVPAAAACR